MPYTKNTCHHVPYTNDTWRKVPYTKDTCEQQPELPASTGISRSASSIPEDEVVTMDEGQGLGMIEIEEGSTAGKSRRGKQSEAKVEVEPGDGTSIPRVSTQQRFHDLPSASPIGVAALKGGGRRMSSDSPPARPEQPRPRGLWAFISGGDKATPFGVP